MKQRYWCCADCETLSPMSQATCGACGGEQTADVAALDPAGVHAFTMDAAYTKSKPKPKRRRR